MQLLPSMVTGLEVTRQQIALWAENHGVCEVCELAKQNRQPFHRRPRAVQTQRLLELVHMDVCGPVPPARDGSRFIVVLLDDYSKYSIVRFLREKAAVPVAVIGVLTAMATQLELPLKQLRSDRGGEFLNQDMASYCEQRGILHTVSAPYTPQQNGAAERLNQTLQKIGRALLVDCGMDPAAHWPLAIAAACYLRVRAPVRGRPLTPYGLFFGVRPRVSNLRVFGSIAYAQTPEHAREHKFGPVAQRGRLVGWTQEGNYRVLLDKGTLLETRHVTFDESPARNAPAAAAPFPDSDSDSDDDSTPAAAAGVAGPPAVLPPPVGAGAEGAQAPGEAQEPGEPQQPGSGGAAAQQQAAAAEDSNNTASNSTEQQTSITQPGAAEGDGGAAAGVGVGAAEAAASAAADLLDQGGSDGSVAAGGQPAGPRRSGRVRQEPARLTTNKLGSYVTVAVQAQVAVIASALPDIDPSWPGGDEPTYEMILTRKDLKWWMEAMEKEMAQLQALSVFEPEELPRGCKALGVRWVFKIKRDNTGKPTLHKARLVVKGYQQVQGRDVFEVWAPTGRLATLRALLAITAELDLELQQLDVNTAFLYGELEDGGAVIYIDQPPGFEVGGPRLKLRLRKALYGLRQAPRAWYAKLKSVLESCGFVESDADPGLFILRTAAGAVFILVHVDDLLLAGENVSTLATFKKSFQSQFAIKDLGDARFYLGMDIVRDRAAKTILLQQSQYTRELLERYGMDLSAPTATPMAEGLHLHRATNATVQQQLLTEDEAGLYRALVGSLMYLANCTRPDIALAVSCLARHMATPTDLHMIAAKRVLRYLRGTAGMGLVYGGGGGLALSGVSEMAEFVLLGYADADYAGDPDTRRSCTGYAYWLGKTVISWQSKLQPTVAGSTVEAEYMAAAFAAREALWLRKLMSDFGVLGSRATILLGDNQGAQALVRNPMHSQQSKHIDVLYHFVRERVALGELEVRYVPTCEMVADMLTKPLPPAKFVPFRAQMGLV